MPTFMAQVEGPVRPNENEGPAILGATLVVTIAALLTVAARLFVRLRIIRNSGWDDYVMTAAMVLCIAGQCVIIPQVYYGAGRHIEYILPAHFTNAFRLNFVTQPLYLVAICLTKVSIGLFLLRIAVEPFYRRLIIGVIGFMVFYTTGAFFTIVLQCTDLRVQWDLTVKGTCWPTSTIKALSYTNQSLNIFTDILFSLAIPIPMLWNVQMNRRQKSSLICILGLGVFATAAALVKLWYVSSYGRTGDWLWDSRNLTIWTCVECNVGIVAGSLPALKPLFRTILGSTYGRGSRKPGESKYGSRPYAPGSNLSATNAKVRARSDAPSQSTRDAYMLTAIHGKAQDERELRRTSSEGKSSTESIGLSGANKLNLASHGGISVTRKFDISESIASNEITEDRKQAYQPQIKELV